MTEINFIDSDLFQPQCKPVVVGLQKSGRLYDESLAFFQNQGVDIGFAKNGLYQSGNTNLSFAFLREKDIPGLIENGALDMGIVGRNTWEESGVGNLTQRLGVCQCRLSLAVPEESTVKTIYDLEDASIATSYPNILNQFLATNGISGVKTNYISGSVETAARLRGDDAILDIVETGNSLRENKFRELETVMQCEAVLLTSNVLNRRLQSQPVNRHHLAFA